MVPRRPDPVDGMTAWAQAFTLLPMFRDFKELSSPTVLGNVPLKALFCNPSNVNAERYPISDGIDPKKL